MDKDNIRHISAKSAIYNYIGKTIVTVIDAVTFVLITKKLLINDYGAYSFFMAVLIFMAFFASLGVPYGLVRFIPEYITHNKKGLARYIIKICLYVLGIFGLIVTVSSFFIAGWMSEVFRVELLKKLLPLLVLTGFINIIIRAEEEILNALFLQVFRNICQVAASFLKLFLFFYILYNGLGIEWLLIAIAVISILQSTTYFSKIYGYFPKGIAPQAPHRQELKRFCVFSIKEYFYVATAFFWDMSFDIYMITYLLDAVSVGFFNFAYAISFFLLNWSPGVVLQSIMSPLFVRQYARNKDMVSVGKLFQFFNKCKAFFIFPAIMCIWLLAGRFELIFYHNKFISAVFVLKILALSVMIQTFTIPIRNIFNIFEKNQFSLYCNVIIIYRVLASFFMIKYFGIIGAAYAYGTSMVLYFFLHLIFVRRIMKITYPVSSLLKISANTLIMAVSIIILKVFMDNNLPWLIIVITAGLLVYMLASYVNRPFQKEESAVFKSAFKGTLSAC